ncbi:hypothetical protein LTR48_008432, partial [Friedmanniomyces endolithicus]
DCSLLSTHLRRLQDLHQTRRTLFPACPDLALRHHTIRPSPGSVLQHTQRRGPEPHLAPDDPRHHRRRRLHTRRSHPPLEAYVHRRGRRFAVDRP